MMRDDVILIILRMLMPMNAKMSGNLGARRLPDDRISYGRSDLGVVDNTITVYGY